MHISLSPAGMPAPIGPYAQCVVTESPKLVFVSGCTSRAPTGEVVSRNDPAGQMMQALQNLTVALGAAGAKLSDVVKITTYVTDAAIYPTIAPIRAQYLTEPFAASTMIEVQALNDPALILEIEAIAAL